LSSPAAHLVEAEPEPGLEQNQADAERHQRLERVAQQGVGMDIVRGSSGREPDRQQEHDRRETQAT
jgi:hypothetical protein